MELPNDDTPYLYNLPEKFPFEQFESSPPFKNIFKDSPYPLSMHFYAGTFHSSLVIH